MMLLGTVPRLGAAGNDPAAGPTPLKKLQRLLRGREKLAITLAVPVRDRRRRRGWFSQNAAMDRATV